MADSKVVHAKTTEKTLRLDDKLLKKISDKAWSLRLSSDQAFMRQVLEEYFKKEEEVKMEKKYSPSVVLTYTNQDTIKKVMQIQKKKDRYLDEEHLEEAFKRMILDGIESETKLEELNKKNQSFTQNIYELESKLKLEQISTQYWKDRVLGKPQEPTKPAKKTKK